jgi:hypothetical protein
MAPHSFGRRPGQPPQVGRREQAASAGEELAGERDGGDLLAAALDKWPPRWRRTTGSAWRSAPHGQNPALPRRSSPGMCPRRTLTSRPRTIRVSPAQAASLRALPKREISASMTRAVNPRHKRVFCVPIRRLAVEIPRIRNRRYARLGHSPRCHACQMLQSQFAPVVMPPGAILDGTRGGPGWLVGGPMGQAPELHPGPQVSGIGEPPQPGGHCQREQHTQTRCERGSHRPGPQPQQAQAQAHHRQHRHIGTAAREPGAAPARYTTGSPIGSAHRAKDAACAVLNPLPCLALPGPAVPPLRWAKPRPEERAAVTTWAAPARPARGGLPRHATVHPAMRTATAPSSAPARLDRALPCEVVIAPSRHGSAGTHLTHRRRDRFPLGRSQASTAAGVPGEDRVRR